MATEQTSVTQLCAEAKAAAPALARAPREVKDAALEALARSLEERSDELIEANALDLAAGAEAGLSAALLDRLLLDQQRIAAIAAGADGVIIEVHPEPTKAMSDGAQSQTPDQFAETMRQLRRVADAIGRSISGSSA